MLPEVGASELLLIALVALIVVGPKDLPVMLRKLGKMMAKLRGMAAEFRASFDEMARQSELDELRREVAAMREGHFIEHRAALEASEAQISQTFDEIHQGLTQDTAPEPVVPVAFEPEPEPAKPKRAVARPSAKAAPAKVAAAKTAKARTAKPRPKSPGTSA